MSKDRITNLNSTPQPNRRESIREVRIEVTPNGPKDRQLAKESYRSKLRDSNYSTQLK